MPRFIQRLIALFSVVSLVLSPNFSSGTPTNTASINRTAVYTDQALTLLLTQNPHELTEATNLRWYAQFRPDFMYRSVWRDSKMAGFSSLARTAVTLWTIGSTVAWMAGVSDFPAESLSAMIIPVRVQKKFSGYERQVIFPIIQTLADPESAEAAQSDLIKLAQRDRGDGMERERFRMIARDLTLTLFHPDAAVRQRAMHVLEVLAHEGVWHVELSTDNTAPVLAIESLLRKVISWVATPLGKNHYATIAMFNVLWPSVGLVLEKVDSSDSERLRQGQDLVEKILATAEEQGLGGRLAQELGRFRFEMLARSNTEENNAELLQYIDALLSRLPKPEGPLSYLTDVTSSLFQKNEDFAVFLFILRKWAFPIYRKSDETGLIEAMERKGVERLVALTQPKPDWSPAHIVGILTDLEAFDTIRKALKAEKERTDTPVGPTEAREKRSAATSTKAIQLKVGEKAVWEGARPGVISSIEWSGEPSRLVVRVNDPERRAVPLEKDITFITRRETPARNKERLYALSALKDRGVPLASLTALLRSHAVENPKRRDAAVGQAIELILGQDFLLQLEREAANAGIIVGVHPAGHDWSQVTVAFWKTSSDYSWLVYTPHADGHVLRRNYSEGTATFRRTWAPILPIIERLDKLTKASKKGQDLNPEDAIAAWHFDELASSTLGNARGIQKAFDRAVRVADIEPEFLSNAAVVLGIIEKTDAFLFVSKSFARQTKLSQRWVKGLLSTLVMLVMLAGGALRGQTFVPQNVAGYVADRISSHRLVPFDLPRTPQRSSAAIADGFEGFRKIDGSSSAHLKLSAA